MSCESSSTKPDVSSKSSGLTSNCDESDSVSDEGRIEDALAVDHEPISYLIKKLKRI